MASLLRSRTGRLATSLHRRIPCRVTAGLPPITLRQRRGISNATASQPLSQPAATAPTDTSLPFPFASLQPDSDTPPPPPPPRSSALRYLIVSAASLAVGAMLASVAEPLSHLHSLRQSSTSLHTLLHTQHPPPALPASAPAWAVQLAADPAFDYKDVTAVFPTANNLVYGALRGDNKLQHVYHFISKQQPATAGTTSGSGAQPEVRVLWELGAGVCGHAGIVHGGLTAALIDQCSGETAFLATGPGSFTANLTVNYHKPLIAGRWVEVQGRVVGVEGRKIRVRVEVAEGAQGEGEGGERLVYATGDVLFVRPKWIPEQTSEWKISADRVQQEQDKAKAQQQQQNMLKTG